MDTSSSSSSTSKGTDENDQSYPEKGSNAQNLKKSTTPTSTAMKHFMSPTLSAASKANPPRKKILAERNDQSLDTHLEKKPSKSTQKPTNHDSRTNSSTEFGDNQENSLIDDLSSRPYDPLTNYLSPRPRFLRYKPNRRREMFVERENVSKDGFLEPKKGADLASSCGSLAQEMNEKQEPEEIDDSDDEELEEFDEERGCWDLKEVLKVMFFMGVLVFSILYISSMNSPTPSDPIVQVVEGVRDGFYMVQDHVYGFMKNLDSEKLFFDADGVQKEVVVTIEKEEETNDGLYEVFVETHSGGEIETVDGFTEGGDIEAVDGFSEGGENEAVEIVEHEKKGTVETEEFLLDLEMAEKEDISDPEIVETEGFLLDQVATDSELQGEEDSEVLEMPVETVSSVADVVEKDNEVMHGEILDMEIGGAENISEEAEITLKVLVIGLSVFSAIIASLVLSLHFRKNRNARKDSDQAEPCFDTVIEEKCGSVIASKEEDKIMSKEHPVSFANSRSQMNSSSSSSSEEEQEESKQTHESRAPTVELLGELVVGEMSSCCSLKSCSKKSRVIESEVSSHSVSMEKKGTGSKASSIPVHLQSVLSELSTTNFLSHTEDKKKIVKEVEEGDIEVKRQAVTATPTPLRRSSRLRNRATSP